MKRVILGFVVGLSILLLPKNEERDIGWLSKFDKERVEDEILLISIDREIEGGRPIPHKRYAECVRRLKDRGFQAIGFDVIFSEDTEGDPDFSREIEAGNVYFGLSFSDKPSSGLNLAGFGLPEANGFIEAKGVTTALSPSCLSSSKGIGHINLTDDPITTGIPSAVSYKDQLFPSIALRIASEFIDADFRIKRDRVVLKRGQKTLQTIYLHQGNIPVKLCKFKTCSFSDLFSGKLPEAKIALIGGEELDLHSTTDGLIPGFTIIGSCISNIIHKETPIHSSFLQKALVLISLCTITFLFPRLIFQTSFCLLYLLLTAFLFRYTGLILEIGRPMLGVFASCSISFILKMKSIERLLLQKESYILKLKKTLGYLQQKITKKRVCKEEIPSKVSLVSLKNGKLCDSKNEVKLTSYSSKLLSQLLKERRLHWIDGWIIFDWLRHPPGNDYKAFLVQVSKLNKEIKRFGIEVKSCGKGWYELSGLERIESSLVGMREMLDGAKRCFADKEKARGIFLEVLEADPENLEALRLLGDEYFERYNLLIKRWYDRYKGALEVIEKGSYDASVMERRDEFSEKLSLLANEIGLLKTESKDESPISLVITKISELRDGDEKERDRLLGELCNSYFFPEILRRQAQGLKREPKEAGLIAISLLFELVLEADFSKITSYEGLKSYIEKALKGRIFDFLKEESGVSKEEELLWKKDRAIDDLRTELGREPTLDEAIGRLGWSKRKWFELERIEKNDSLLRKGL